MLFKWVTSLRRYFPHEECVIFPPAPPRVLIRLGAGKKYITPAVSPEHLDSGGEAVPLA